MIDAVPAAAPLAAITGPPGADLRAALQRRADALAASGLSVLAFGPGAMTFDRLAIGLLREFVDRTPFPADLRLIGPAAAETLFAAAAAPLFSAAWEDWLGPELDPDVAGLRAPQRFAAAAFRLIRKLRDAGITPEAFRTAALQGAAAFYAAPPNLASPALLFAVKDEHRGSLAVDAVELERQRTREIDLAKIVAKLYRAYLDEVVACGRLTGVDAIAEAVALLDAHADVAKAVRSRWNAAVVAGAEDLRGGEIDLLERLFPDLRGVTVAGEPALATQTFAGARPERLFGRAAPLEIETAPAVPPRLAAAARAIVAADGRGSLPGGEGLRLLRARDRAAEIAAVADDVAARVRDGVAPGRIAVLGRTLRTMTPFADALTARGVPVAVRGDFALAHRADVLDALGALWFAVDPFRHAWTLRVLAMPLCALSDASIAILCGEPSDPQAALFALPAADDDGERRWDRRRDLRLGTNVVRGDRDADLGAPARERVQALRERRLRWRDALRGSDLAAAARAIVTDAGALAARAGETPARADLRAVAVAELLELIAEADAGARGDDPATVLDRVGAALGADDPPEIDDRRADRVVVASVERARHDRFDEVYVVDARAGAFPPYYVPDAFLFSPQLGMVPKDSAGDAPAARTAKFTWYHHRMKLRERYNEEARRAFACALTRAEVRATVTAAGRPTRGVAAPELLAELLALAPDAAIAPPAPCRLAPEPPAAAPPPATSVARTAPAFVTLEAAAGLCAACGARERAAFSGGVAPLLRPPPAAPWREVACDVRVLVADPGGPPVTGTVEAVVDDGAERFVVVRGAAAGARAALAARALDGVARERYVRRETDGSLAGPFPAEPPDEERMRTAPCAGCGATSAPP